MPFEAVGPWSFVVVETPSEVVRTTPEEKERALEEEERAGKAGGLGEEALPSAAALPLVVAALGVAV